MRPARDRLDRAASDVLVEGPGEAESHDDGVVDGRPLDAQTDHALLEQRDYVLEVGALRHQSGRRFRAVQ